MRLTLKSHHITHPQTLECDDQKSFRVQKVQCDLTVNCVRSIALTFELDYGSKVYWRH